MITDRALMTLRSIVQVSMLINVFLLVNEVFKEFYSRTAHVASSEYLYFGLHGHHALVPWIWTAISFNLVSMFLLVLPLSKSLKYLNLACVLAIVGIWIEKGMGLVVPGFIPTPLGEMVEYTPTINETMVCLGIWAFGMLAYTVFLRMSIPILQGKICRENEGRPDHETLASSEVMLESTQPEPDAETAHIG
jgi:Ni/Fe-hydrogenase subunit HybB-like protein